MSEKPTSLFGLNLKTLREDSGLSQEELSRLVWPLKRTRVGAVQISKYERGEQTPRPDTQNVLAKVLGCDVADFYSDRSFINTPRVNKTAQVKMEQTDNAKEEKTTIYQKLSGILNLIDKNDVNPSQAISKMFELILEMAYDLISEKKDLEHSLNEVQQTIDSYKEANASLLKTVKDSGMLDTHTLQLQFASLERAYNRLEKTHDQLRNNPETFWIGPELVSKIFEIQLLLGGSGRPSLPNMLQLVYDKIIENGLDDPESFADQYNQFEHNFEKDREWFYLLPDQSEIVSKHFERKIAKLEKEKEALRAKISELQKQLNGRKPSA